MTNQIPGLARGPIDHNASAVINVIANGQIDMGSSVKLHTTIISSEILPRVEETDADDDPGYGVAVGGDRDGVYGDGTKAGGVANRAANNGEGVVVVTQGRCPARVLAKDKAGTDAEILIGTALTAGQPGGGAGDGLLIVPEGSTETIIARALQPVAAGDNDVIAVDIQREGYFT